MVSHSLKKAFTLIELLVVIATVAFLLAVIVPALRNAKLCAKQVVCAAQMRQWTLATAAYASQNDNAIPPYADAQDMTKGGNALNPETYWYNRLSPYLTGEDHGRWGMDYGNRRCPMGRSGWGEKAVWVGVYYGEYHPDRAPFVYLNRWDGSALSKQCNPFKITTIRTPANYLMMLDVRRDDLFEPVRWQWDMDFDGDGMNDSNSGVAAGLGPYNFAKPKIHRGGCNVSLFDGHVEWIRYETFWEFGADGYPVHSYWWNQNRP